MFCFKVRILKFQTKLTNFCWITTTYFGGLLFTWTQCIECNQITKYMHTY